MSINPTVYIRPLIKNVRPLPLSVFTVEKAARVQGHVPRSGPASQERQAGPPHWHAQGPSVCALYFSKQHYLCI